MMLVSVDIQYFVNWCNYSHMGSINSSDHTWEIPNSLELVHIPIHSLSLCREPNELPHDVRRGKRFNCLRYYLAHRGLGGTKVITTT